MKRLDKKSKSPLFEIAHVLVRLDHGARFIVNANHGAASDFQAIGEDPAKFKAFVNAAAARKNNRNPRAIVTFS